MKLVYMCASRWLFSRICITMHGSENIKFDRGMLSFPYLSHLGYLGYHVSR